MPITEITWNPDEQGPMGSPVPVLAQTAAAGPGVTLMSTSGPAPLLATHFSVVLPNTVDSGVEFQFTVTALNEIESVVTDYEGTVTFTSTSAGTLPVDYTFTLADAGTHTFNATLDETGAQSITATDTVSLIEGTDETEVIATELQEGFYLLNVNGPLNAYTWDASLVLSTPSAPPGFFPTYIADCNGTAICIPFTDGVGNAVLNFYDATGSLVASVPKPSPTSAYFAAIKDTQGFLCVLNDDDVDLMDSLDLFDNEGNFISTITRVPMNIIQTSTSGFRAGYSDSYFFMDDDAVAGEYILQLQNLSTGVQSEIFAWDRNDFTVFACGGNTTSVFVLEYIHGTDNLDLVEMNHSGVEQQRVTLANISSYTSGAAICCDETQMIVYIPSDLVPGGIMNYYTLPDINTPTPLALPAAGSVNFAGNTGVI